MKYRRVLIKLSGEALLGAQAFGLDSRACGQIAATIQQIASLGVQVGIVIGGGNIFRGNQLKMDRVVADQIGMLATLMNGMALSQALTVPSRVLSAIPSLAEPYSHAAALRYLEQGIITIFVGGTGNPYFTTDSAAALRALEIQADVLIKATKVDGIYNKDPLKYSEAIKFDRVTYSDVLAKQLEVMDATAIALCREKHMPIRVVNMHSLIAAVRGETVGTLVEGA